MREFYWWPPHMYEILGDGYAVLPDNRINSFDKSGVNILRSQPKGCNHVPDTYVLLLMGEIRDQN